MSKIAGQNIKTIDDLARLVKSGEVATTSITLETVRRGGVTYILNTRTAQALERAGVKRKDWKLVDKTGDSGAERRLTSQLERNDLKPGDIVTKPTSQSGGSGGSGGGLGGFLRDLVRAIFGGK